MADKKISALTASSTPLAGTEVLPIVQSGSTVKVAVSDLTAGRSFNALGMTLTSTDASATAAPLLDLYRDSASPAASDTLGEIEFNGEDSAGNKQTYGVIHGSILSPTSTAEQGQLHFETATAGALTEKMIIGTTNLVINEIGGIFNVRIEGDTDANLFYTDATNSRVGVGTISPAEKLDVVGKIKLSDDLVIGTAGKGIDFSANGGDVLSQYDEGTWSPTIFDALTGGNQGTSTGSSGIYTRVGNLVTIHAAVVIAGKGSMAAANTLYIGGLPFTAKNVTNVDYHGVTDSRAVITTSGGVVGSWLQAGAARLRLFTTTAAGSVNGVAVSNVTAGSTFVFMSLTYLAA
jgi:hypothetical protein